MFIESEKANRSWNTFSSSPLPSGFRRSVGIGIPAISLATVYPRR